MVNIQPIYYSNYDYTKLPEYSNNNRINNSYSKQTPLADSDSTNTYSGNWFNEWIDDKDKVCKDGFDDGKLSFK